MMGFSWHIQSHAPIPCSFLLLLPSLPPFSRGTPAAGGAGPSMTNETTVGRALRRARHGMSTKGVQPASQSCWSTAALCFWQMHHDGRAGGLDAFLSGRGGGQEYRSNISPNQTCEGRSGADERAALVMMPVAVVIMSICLDKPEWDGTIIGGGVHTSSSTCDYSWQMLYVEGVFLGRAGSIRPERASDIMMVCAASRGHVVSFEECREGGRGKGRQGHLKW
ncbi:uncharacterized protein LY79DRAFT_372501 [Colletotrichum navitas]|uniref:Uncharacterized protein n=1 Tax=Colletotrichum navitas TaxID=681940 RepID=A0AAD8PPS9_9PEZI|nr:uncharacterized protein LY79DRAFT_372501 [Colletotrichum navitas]KAK1574165.1 hypothetical protein LY79DRAFT_372501 [Colletotrichum navitas]